MASQQTPESSSGVDAAASGHQPRDAATPDRTRGIKATVLGGVVMVLAPLFGFLGGSMSGVGGTVGGPDPLAVWLLGGMVIGGIGGIIAILGLLRWTRSSTRTRTRP